MSIEDARRCLEECIEHGAPAGNIKTDIDNLILEVQAAMPCCSPEVLMGHASPDHAHLGNCTEVAYEGYVYCPSCEARAFLETKV